MTRQAATVKRALRGMFLHFQVLTTISQLRADFLIKYFRKTKDPCGLHYSPVE